MTTAIALADLAAAFVESLLIILAGAALAAVGAAVTRDREFDSLEVN